MNGGVSLAVWMSGVTREIDRLRRHDGPYGELLDLMHATARVDVIAGASAGGLAGTLLGLAVGTESEVSSAFGLWIERGGLKAMVRDPFEPDPPSLLRGDDYFLGEVNKALTTIVGTAGNHPTGGGDVADAKDHDLHVIVTTTTLSGEQTGYPDYFGTVIRDVDHRQAFHFKRTRDSARNDFGVDERSIARLALAGRTTSSFPGAFEPSFIPVRGDGKDDFHPAMRGIATFDNDRWAVDGGVLVNTPFRRALDAIKTLSAEREVRRVLVYIVASTGSTISLKDDRLDEMPTLRDVVVDALTDLPRIQSSREEMEEIADINRRAAERKRARRELLLELGSVGLAETAELLRPAYIRTRTASAFADIARIVVDELGHGVPADKPAPTVDLDALEGAVLPALPTLSGPLSVDDPGDWTWGLAPIEYGANVVLDFLREALRLTGPDELRLLLQRLRGNLHEELATIRSLQTRYENHWRGQAQDLAAGRPKENAEEWRAEVARATGRVAVRLGRIAAEAAEALPGWAGDDPEVSETVRLARALVPNEPDPVVGAVRTIVALHIVQRASGSELAGMEQTVDLVQLSANASNSFDGRNRASDKLAGLQLHHFGAFYKRSWRANDWLWGRLDGATRLVQIVLDPARLQRLGSERGLTAAQAADRIVAIATSGATDEERAYLSSRWKIERLRGELAFVDHESAEPPKTLPLCWGALATGLQWRILHEQLADVAAAARADVSEKCLDTASGAIWAKELPPERVLTPGETVDLFSKCFVGSEKVESEFATDYYTALVSQTGAVAGSVLKGKSSGLPSPARRLATLVRGILIALYLLARGVTSGGRFGMFAVAITLAIGGAFLALTLIARPPALVTSLGMILVLAGFLLAFLRGAGWRFVIATALVIALVIGAAVLAEWKDEWFDDLPNWLERLLPIVPIVFLATLTMLLGLIHGRPKPGNEQSG